MSSAVGVNVTSAVRTTPARGSMVGEVHGLPLAPQTRPAPIAGASVP